jgi:2-iminoacetate synthase ThiH
MSRVFPEQKKEAEEEYDKAIASWRPVFGNINHIQISKLAGQLETALVKLEKKGGYRDGSTALEAEVIGLKRQIAHFIKNNL